MTLLALAKLGPDDAWAKVQRPLLRIWDIMGFMRDVHGKDYAANSRETIRRQTIHQFEQARIVDRNPDDPDRPTNSGKTVYVLTEEAAEVLRTYGKPAFKKAIKEFIEQFGSLKIAYERAETHRIPLRLPDGVTVYLSPGEHNALQVAIIEEFGPRFAPGAEVLYVGDTAKKHVIFESPTTSASRPLLAQPSCLEDPSRSTLLGKLRDECIGVSERDDLRVFHPGAVLQTGAVADRSPEGRDAILQSRSLGVPRQGCALVEPFHRAEAVQVGNVLGVRDFDPNIAGDLIGRGHTRRCAGQRATSGQGDAEVASAIENKSDVDPTLEIADGRATGGLTATGRRSPAPAQPRARRKACRKAGPWVAAPPRAGPPD